MERSGAKRARRGAARLMSLAHDVIGSGAREAALIGVKRFTPTVHRSYKLQCRYTIQLQVQTVCVFVYRCENK